MALARDQPVHTLLRRQRDVCWVHREHHGGYASIDPEKIRRVGPLLIVQVTLVSDTDAVSV
jgi:hypothetical protein